MSRRIYSAALGVALLAAMVTSVPAQSIGDRLKAKAKQRTDEQTDKTMDKALDKAENTIKCVAGDDACVAKAKESGKQVVITDKKGNPLPNQPKSASADATAAPASDAATPESNDPPGKGVWLNYDFIPGDRTIYYEDFSGDDVGDFPRRMNLKEGNLEVVNVKGKKMLRSVEGGYMFVVLPEKLPDHWTFEMTFHGFAYGNPVKFQTTDSPGERSSTWGCYGTSAWVASNGSGGPDNSGSSVPGDPPNYVTCTFTVDNGRGIKGYINEHRTANAPGSHILSTDTLFIQIPGASEEDPGLLSTIRIAAGGRKLYDVLSASGRVSTHGILFDTGLDQIRGESTPTLKEIGQMLKDHPELKLTIEGHTDNVGQSATNLTLSQKRADAVKAYLVANFGVDAARLTTKGYGDTKPADKNDTAQGRQNNRRVELVKGS